MLLDDELDDDELLLASSSNEMPIKPQSSALAVPKATVTGVALPARSYSLPQVWLPSSAVSCNVKFVPAVGTSRSPLPKAANIRLPVAPTGKLTLGFCVVPVVLVELSKAHPPNDGI